MVFCGVAASEWAGRGGSLGLRTSNGTLPRSKGKTDPVERNWVRYEGVGRGDLGFMGVVWCLGLYGCSSSRYDAADLLITTYFVSNALIHLERNVLGFDVLKSLTSPLKEHLVNHALEFG